MFSYNEKYLIKDGRPWFPIMGEFHYSRYPKELWKDALLRMKAGGVDVVSTYVIWIHHEEIENEFDFEGNKDLHAFAEACKEVGIYMFLRIGPWSHAEARNGGFPDWLMKKPFEVRTNDRSYLETVHKFYEKIYEQVEGEFIGNGGAIIGIQIENEYGHCGGLNGDEGNRHMRYLTDMAREIGFEAPLYTATGWGGAMTGGLIPVMGGYCEAPWDQRLTEIEPSGNYIFTHERNDHNIGSDYGFGTGITFDMNKFPYLTAELGGGLQVTHHRRPVAHAEDIGAMSLVKLGSGVNLLGYYMYHGGTNPHGKLTTLQESRETGYLNDLPEYSYDFNAPIKEYGQPSETFKELKLYAMFVHDFGNEFCEMPADIPEENPLRPENLSDLRYSFRHNGKSGYLFVNNFQRRYEMKPHKNVKLSLQLSNEKINFPEFSVENGDYFFCPFNMKIGKAVLKNTLSSPLCRVNNAYFFYTDKSPCYEIEGDIGENKIITLSRTEALNANKIALDGKEYLIITDGFIAGKALYSSENAEIKTYPALPRTPDGFKRIDDEDEFAVYTKINSADKANVSFEKISADNEKAVYEIKTSVPQNADDCILYVDFAGDKAKLFIDGKQESDYFYTGEPWQIGLKRFGFDRKIIIEVYPLAENAEVFLESKPKFEKGIACNIDNITAKAVYKSEVL